MYKIYLLVLSGFFCGIAFVKSQDQARCFRYTWLGPQFNNQSVFMNATCQDATRLASGVPCEHPLVVSQDGTWPDVNHIWANHRDAASCVLADSDVCAIYTYYFNGHVENSTHMCTRVMDSAGATITNGCFQQTNGSWTTRVCFCRSIPNTRPCNRGAASTSSNLCVVAILISIFFSYENVYKYSYTPSSRN